jgi:hypothetical protein
MHFNVSIPVRITHVIENRKTDVLLFCITCVILTGILTLMCMLCFSVFYYMCNSHWYSYIEQSMHINVSIPVRITHVIEKRKTEHAL